jgi:hypothetical protein
MFADRYLLNLIVAQRVLAVAISGAFVKNEQGRSEPTEKKEKPTTHRRHRSSSSSSKRQRQ